MEKYVEAIGAIKSTLTSGLPDREQLAEILVEVSRVTDVQVPPSTHVKMENDTFDKIQELITAISIVIPSFQANDVNDVRLYNAMHDLKIDAEKKTGMIIFFNKFSNNHSTK